MLLLDFLNCGHEVEELLSLMNVAVIGAGAAGLCCARYLSRLPDLFNFSVFEQSKQVGGTWVYSDSTDTDEYGLPVHSSMYENLR